MNQEQFEDIKSYLDKFESGELTHDQEAYHQDCGTCHCLAGWKVFHMAVAAGITPTWKAFDPEYPREMESQEIEIWCAEEFRDPYPSAVAALAWGLDTCEADNLLFATKLTLEEMRMNLTRLAEQYGLEV